MGISSWKVLNRPSKIRVAEVVIIGIILTGVALLPLGVARLPRGVKSLDINNIGNIGLPQSAVDKLKDLLKP